VFVYYLSIERKKESSPPGSHSVHLDISPPCGQELFINIGSIPPDGSRVGGVVIGTAILYFSEQAFHSAPHRMRVVYVDVVILARGGLLDKWLVDADAVQLNVVLGLDEALCSF
jgi:hypothetical protein